jgi:hypothetical protein
MNSNQYELEIIDILDPDQKRNFIGVSLLNWDNGTKLDR